MPYFCFQNEQNIALFLRSDYYMSALRVAELKLMIWNEKKRVFSSGARAHLHYGLLLAA